MVEYKVELITDTTQPRRETKKDKITIAELSVGPVDEHGSQTWQQKLDIPPLPPSNLVNCGIIDLDYELKVRFCWPTCKKDQTQE